MLKIISKATFALKGPVQTGRPQKRAKDGVASFSFKSKGNFQRLCKATVKSLKPMLKDHAITIVCNLFNFFI